MDENTEPQDDLIPKNTSANGQQPNSEEAANTAAQSQPDEAEDDEKITDITPLSGLYENWFLDYASYVILERAIPAIEDGFKPVQRRILHAMNEMDDGRFNKVANIIGSTMQYHPHGDASIGDAIVNIGQRDLLIEPQGNWGDIRTGDSAAAPRYIEARLSKFAKEVVFNGKTTDWQLSYDGRKREPVTLPVKFPMLLAQGADGIAVGLSTKILPHNFGELIEGSINILKGKKAEIYPDFLTGGSLDVSNYNDGKRGGKIRVRATIESTNNKSLLVTQIPYTTTTTSLIDSILKANSQGKIKVKKVTDNTARDVEIEIQLPNGVSPEVTIDALYAFTDCEVSISPNACIIIDNRPYFPGVSEILKTCTEQTMALLGIELEILIKELQEKLLYASLERIFIENRIYRDIEEAETWEAVLQIIDQGLEPYKKDFYREITQDDIVRLTEIKIKRISKYDTFKADELLKTLETELDEARNNLENLRDYTILYYKSLLKKYGKGRERKTEIRSFDSIVAAAVALNNQKLYVDRAGGFIGYSLKKEEYVCDCSDLDDIVVIRQDGTAKVVKIDEKVFVGKNIEYVGVFDRNDTRMVYNLAYLDGSTGVSYVKRFQMGGVTREREYPIFKQVKGSKMLYFSANANGEAETVNVQLVQSAKARMKNFDYDFAELDVKGRSAKGNILSKYPVRKVKFKMAGDSTLGGLDIWFDETTGRLNTDKRGQYLGKFDGADQILSIYTDGCYELKSYELTNHFDPKKLLYIDRHDPEQIVSAVYYEGEQKQHYIKRFHIETTTPNKSFCFISSHRSSKLEAVTTANDAQVEVWTKKSKSSKAESQIFDMDMLIDVRGWKAIGNKLSAHQVTKVAIIENEKKPAGPSLKAKPDVAESDKTKKEKDQLGLF